VLDTNKAIAERLRLLRFLVAGESQTEFARQLGISLTRWNNFECGSPLSKEVAILLVKMFPGITLDWLFLGVTDGLPLRRLWELDAAAAAQR
jgi:transcriptional regulator with XRE-family HTH domain